MNKILPKILAIITRHPRQRVVAGVDFEWSTKSWTHNFFRAYELIFWRRYGIKAESTTYFDGVKTYHWCHSWESVFAYKEVALREFFSKIKLPVRIGVAWLQPIGFAPIPIPYLFAIATDAFTDGGALAASPKSFNHTCTGSNLLLFGSGRVASTTDPFTAVSYNSVALTKVKFSPMNAGGDYYGHSMWALAGPSTGTNSLSFTFSSGTATGFAGSYSGCSQTGVPDSSNTGTATSTTSMTVSTTVVASNCWLHMAAADGGTNITAGTGTTLRTGGVGSGESALFDSNGTVGTGSQSLQTTWTNTQNGGGVVASFAPVASASATIVTSGLPFLHAG